MDHATVPRWVGWILGAPAAPYAALRAGSTDNLIPTAFSAARRVLSVGFPFGDSARYSDSRLNSAPQGITRVRADLRIDHERSIFRSWMDRTSLGDSRRKVGGSNGFAAATI